jgi:cell division protein FtsL
VSRKAGQRRSVRGVRSNGDDNSSAGGLLAASLPDDGVRRWLLAGVVVYVLVAATGVLIASQSQQMRELVMEMERSQQVEDALLAEQTRLLLERSTLASFQQVDDIAEAQLNMRFPELVEKVHR